VRHRPRGRLPWRSGVAFALLLAITRLPSGVAPAAAAPLERGRDLFVGRIQLHNGGPPCGACHAISSLGFPNGGLVGPDLSGAYQMLGPDGLDVTLQTLFFPTMVPLYDKRPLTPGEQQALKSFLQGATAGSSRQRDTLAIGALALGGFLLLIVTTWLASRRRLRAVRSHLVLAFAGRRTGIRPS
jgi:hypothetical protein